MLHLLRSGEKKRNGNSQRGEGRAARMGTGPWFAHRTLELFAAAALALSVPAVAGCSSSETVEDGSTRGTLQIYVATFPDGTSKTEYRLQIDGDETNESLLVFDQEPDLTSGAELKVWGDRSGAEILVSRYEVVEDEAGGLGRSQEAIIDGPPYPNRSFAVVLVDIGGGINRTAAELRADVFGTAAADGSVKQYFLEASYGRQDLTGDVYGPFDFNLSNCNTASLANTLRPMVPTANHYLWYIGSDARPNGCAWGGLGEVGSPTSPANDTWYNASSSCVVLVQEPGHNFGMQHSSSMRCGSQPFANDPEASCTHDEYGDRYDPMGGACRHMNAWQKSYQGWFGGCNSVRVNTSGTFTLHPIENECNGIQVLQIPMPATRYISRAGGGGQASRDALNFYYLELRTRVGFDQPMTNAPTVLVHVAPDYRTRSQTGLHTWILDMNPATTGANGFDGMGAGQTFTDPAGGVSFTVQALSATSATVNVTVPGSSANTCAGGGTIVPPGPGTCGGGSSGAGGMGGAGMGGAGAGGRGGAGAGGAGAGGRGGTGAGGAGAGGAGASGAGASGAGASGAGAGGVGTGGVGGAAAAAGVGGNAGGFAGAGGAVAGGAAGFGPAGAAGSLVAGSAGVATAGAAGTAPIAGAGGASAAGAGNLAGSGSTPTAAADDLGTIDPGCGCRVPSSAPRQDAAALLGFLGLAVGGLLRRRRAS